MSSYNAMSPEQKEHAVLKAAKWADENRERRKEIARAYYHRHKEKILADAKARTAAKPKKERPPAKGRDPEKARLRNQKYEAKHRERLLARQREIRAERVVEMRLKEKEYRSLNRERLNATGRLWASRNKESVKANVHRRRTRKRGAPGFHTAADISALRSAQRNRCGYCRKPLRGKGHVDHIIALARGGSNWPKNLQILCAHCNISKNAHDPIDFARSKGMLI